ncbi:hypothetical protein [Azospirillum doebereinerae]|uniref:Uncharacterized protein n=1 Tax=Azospirillum doebereinerae TaxID=92933 RepID=A0A433J4W4_9PROT|nr:hypothetical protein [Azospirillum doebereinerae]RUQ67465.1 hypothetical protein EJ913_19780 [Azospirillum doebereinerae]
MAKPLHVLWKKPSDTGAYSGGAWVAGGGLALTNLTTQDVQEVARSTDTAEASTWWRIDFGRLTPLSMFALLNHNGSTLARRRHIVTNSPDNSGPPVYDTGFERMRVPTVVWGAEAFGAFPFDGIDADAYPGGTVDLHIAPEPVYGRYLFTQISDEDNPAGYVQAGRFMAGEAWAHRYTYGLTVKPVDPSVVKRTRGGLRLVRKLPGYRTVTVTFEHMLARDAYGTGFEIDRQLGKSGDFLLVCAPDEDPSLRFRRTVYAALTDTVGITTTSLGRYGWAINAEELV